MNENERETILSRRYHFTKNDKVAKMWYQLLHNIQKTHFLPLNEERINCYFEKVKGDINKELFRVQ